MTEKDRHHNVQTWLKTQPQYVRDLHMQCPPGIYRILATGREGELYAYETPSEDRPMGSIQLLVEVRDGEAIQAMLRPGTTDYVVFGLVPSAIEWVRGLP